MTVGAVNDPVRQVAADVRDRLRAQGVDPHRDPGVALALVRAATADYDERALGGAWAPLGDPAATVGAVWDDVAGFGPLQVHLDDPTVEEIWINAPDQVFVARHGVPELTATVLDDDQVRDLVERMLHGSGRRLDVSSPFVDATLPDGSRLHVVIPDVTRRTWAVNIRKFTVRATCLDDLVALGTLTPAAAGFLTAAVASGLSVLVSGATQAGKTTMLNALLGAVPPRDRVITCEEVFELRPAVRDCVALQCRQAGLEGTGAVPLRRLVTEALRMRPDRIVVGEVRQAESLDLLIALNSGLPGMASVHANSAREALTKMCTLPLLAGENVSSKFVVPTVAASIDLVVHLGLDARGARRVREVAAVPGRVEDGVVEVCDVFVQQGDDLVRGRGFPPHAERFARAGYDLAQVLAGAA